MSKLLENQYKQIINTMIGEDYSYHYYEIFPAVRAEIPNKKQKNFVIDILRITNNGKFYSLAELSREFNLSTSAIKKTSLTIIQYHNLISLKFENKKYSFSFNKSQITKMIKLIEKAQKELAKRNRIDKKFELLNLLSLQNKLNSAEKLEYHKVLNEYDKYDEKIYQISEKIRKLYNHDVWKNN